MRARLAGAVIGVALAVLAVGCGGAGRVDTREVERSLVSDYVVVEGAVVETADCPNQVDRGAGGTFVCAVTVDGQQLDVRVVQVDDDGTVRFEQQHDVFDAAQVAGEVASEMGRALGQPVTARCGSSPLIVTEPGALVRCEVVDENGSVLPVDAEVGDEGVLSVTPA